MKEPYGNIVKVIAESILIWLVVTVGIVVFPLSSMAIGIEWGGEFESELYVNDKWGDPEVGSINSFTLIGDAELNENVTFHTRIIFNYFTGYKFDQLNGLISDVDIDRLHLNLYLDKVDLRVGKQRLAWGSGYVFNPTDVFNPPDYTDPGGERPGVSAVRITVPLGEVSEIMLIGAQSAERPVYDATNGKWLKPAVKAQDAEFALRGKTNWAGFDLSLIAIDLGEDDSEKIGGGFSGEVFGLGVWLEGALTFPEDEAREEHDEKNYWQVVFGTDFTFLNGLYLLGEYYRNERGKWSYRDYEWTRLREGELVNLGRDYFFGNASYDLTDLTQISFAGLININDSSFFYQPQLQYSIYDDTMIEGGMHGFYGFEGREFYGEKNSVRYHIFNEVYLKFIVNF